jgi:hypothetical protein
LGEGKIGMKEVEVVLAGSSELLEGSSIKF